jgi:hypothetical protein
MWSAGANARHVVHTAAEVSVGMQQRQQQQQQVAALQEARQSLASRLAASDIITQPLYLSSAELKGEWQQQGAPSCTVAAASYAACILHTGCC